VCVELVNISECTVADGVVESRSRLLGVVLIASYGSFTVGFSEILCVLLKSSLFLSRL
jgi:hypothetical protein